MTVYRLLRLAQNYTVRYSSLRTCSLGYLIRNIAAINTSTCIGTLDPPYQHLAVSLPLRPSSTAACLLSLLYSAEATEPDTLGHSLHIRHTITASQAQRNPHRRQSMRMLLPVHFWLSPSPLPLSHLYPVFSKHRFKLQCRLHIHRALLAPAYLVGSGRGSRREGKLNDPEDFEASTEPVTQWGLQVYFRHSVSHSTFPLSIFLLANCLVKSALSVIYNFHVLRPHARILKHFRQRVGVEFSASPIVPHRISHHALFLTDSTPFGGPSPRVGAFACHLLFACCFNPRV